MSKGFFFARDHNDQFWNIVYGQDYTMLAQIPLPRGSYLVNACFHFHAQPLPSSSTEHGYGEAILTLGGHHHKTDFDLTYADGEIRGNINLMTAARIWSDRWARLFCKTTWLNLAITRVRMSAVELDDLIVSGLGPYDAIPADLDPHEEAPLIKDFAKAFDAPVLIGG